jgi:putative peptide zinc metalloprotease protein
MRFGATSLRVSSVLAKGLRRPKLRSDLRISEQTIAGEKSYVVKVLETNSYNRYGTTEYELLTLCDGTRTPAEISQELSRKHHDEPLTEAEVLDFLDGIEPTMWERSVGEKNLAVLERIRDERRGRLDQSSVLYISFKAWDPNKFLARIDPYLGWMFTPGFVFASSLLFLVAAYLVAGDWTRVANDTKALYTFQNKTAYDIWAFWFLLFVVGGIHECGHGLTCKHFGGDVHQMGFLLIYFTPAFFTDTTDIVLFERGSRRQWVIFAGIWVELTVCALAVLVWRFTLPGSVINDLAYKTMLLSGIQGALLNLNPLIKADGYYALSQFLDIDNLREDAFGFLRAAARKYLLREDVDLPRTSRRLRRIFAVFGLSAIAYSVALILLVLGFVKNVLVRKFGTWGYVFTLAIAFFFARKGLKKAVPAVRAWWREKKEVFMAWRLTRRQQIGALAVGLLLIVPPFPSRVASDFVLEPGNDIHVRAIAPGLVRQVLVREGDRVEPGQLLAVLENPDVATSKRILGQELALASAKVRTVQERPEGRSPEAAIRERKRLEEEFAVAENHANELEIRAPHAGIVRTPDVDQKAGEYFYAGDEFCRIVDRTTMRARILVHDWDLDKVRREGGVRMKVAAFPFRTYSGRVERILPAAATDRPVAQPQSQERLGQELSNYFGVVVDLPNADGLLREGMTGTAKLYGGWSPMAWKLGRGAWRWLRSQVW